MLGLNTSCDPCCRSTLCCPEPAGACCNATAASPFGAQGAACCRGRAPVVGLEPSWLPCKPGKLGLARQRRMPLFSCLPLPAPSLLYISTCSLCMSHNGTWDCATPHSGLLWRMKPLLKICARQVTMPLWQKQGTACNASGPHIQLWCYLGTSRQTHA